MGQEALSYSLGKPKGSELLQQEFELSLKRAVAQRIRRGFIKTYKPILDDVPYRIFSSLRDYRLWCAEKLPKWLGYGKAG